MSVDDVAAMRRQPSWRARLASVPTMSRELRTADGLEEVSTSATNSSAMPGPSPSQR
jgi:hypothetical protein